MILGLLALYCPWQLLDGRHTLLSVDYGQIHGRRIRYAQEALFGQDGHLPAWSTRELMGAPFWSNLQSFPFLPTRLALLGVDPGILYPIAVNLGAILAALFTYLYLRRLSLGRLAAATAGWTFSASGFFASRVLCGHLAILEAFGALPLLLWIVECIAQSDPADRRLRKKHLGLSLAVLCVVVAGHPQIPAYAVGAAILYAVARLWRRGAGRALAAMVLGIALSGFVWVPMFSLISRSTRVLDLDRHVNDICFPYERLAAFLFPWADGWPSAVRRLPAREFVGPLSCYFWDTVCYVGWMPWIAVLVLAGRMIRERRPPAPPWRLLAVLGVGALILALPFARSIAPEIHVTLLRSPSRLTYLTTFALAAAVGVLVDLLMRWRAAGRRIVALAGIALLLALHAADLATHDRPFLQIADRPRSSPEMIHAIRQGLADQRVAVDLVLEAPVGGEVDDVGFYDSLLLARPYRAFLAMSGAEERASTEHLDGSHLPARALAALGVERVVTKIQRKDLPVLSVGKTEISYAVPDPAPRAVFLPDARVEFLADASILDGLRADRLDLRTTMFLPPSARTGDFGSGELRAGAPPSAEETTVRYQRPDGDHIVVRTKNSGLGYLRVVESWDEGWSAVLDGQPTGILVADSFAMAVRLPPGDHEVRFAYATPGARLGAAVTLVAAALLATLLLVLRGRPTDRLAGRARLRTLVLLASATLLAWLGSSAMVAWRLTHRARPPYSEPVPARAAGRVEEVLIHTRDGQRLGA